MKIVIPAKRRIAAREPGSIERQATVERWVPALPG
jgi:hypothetical protein